MLERVRNKIRSAINGGNGGRPAKETMLILFLSGILIFVILLPTGDGNSSFATKKSQKNVANPGSAEDSKNSLKEEGNETIEGYKKGLEQELEEFLSSVAGVGAVKVLIYIKESSEYVVEKDIPTSNTINGENSEVKKEEATVYTVNGNGEQVPFIAQTKSPQIDGVVISAEGAYDEAVRLQIVKLVMALYGVEANKVEVLRMGQAIQK